MSPADLRVLAALGGFGLAVLAAATVLLGWLAGVLFRRLDAAEREADRLRVGLAAAESRLFSLDSSVDRLEAAAARAEGSIDALDTRVLALQARKR